MDVYKFIVQSLGELPKNELPIKLEMNKATHKMLVENMKDRMKSDNIISIETLFHLPIFVNNALKDTFVKIVTDHSKIDICLNCASKYSNLKNYHLLVYKEDNQCELCHVVCKTAKMSTKHIDFTEVKKQMKPNI